MNTETKLSLHVARRFSVPPERVFAAWLDPQKAARFLFATPSAQIVRAKIDARVGGSFTIVDRRDGEDIEHFGEYVEIDHARRLSFTFRVPKFSAETTGVTVDIVPLETGCELTLTHEGVPADYEDRARAGWTMILDALQNVVEEAQPE